MLRYKTETRPDLVALYDIWPGNGAGPFLQPRSPHSAQLLISENVNDWWIGQQPNVIRPQAKTFHKRSLNSKGNVSAEGADIIVCFCLDQLSIFVLLHHYHVLMNYIILHSWIGQNQVNGPNTTNDDGGVINGGIYSKYFLCSRKVSFYG